jgi:hypothetical protein
MDIRSVTTSHAFIRRFQLKNLSSMACCRSDVVEPGHCARARVRGSLSRNVNQDTMAPCTRTIDTNHMIAVTITLGTFVSEYFFHKGNHDRHRARKASKAADCCKLRESKS